MNIIVTICLLSLSIFIYYSNKKAYYPAFIFCLLYGAIMFLENLGLYDMNRSAMKTYIIILFGVVSFCVGSELIQRCKFCFGRRCAVDNNEHYSINFRLFIFLLFFAVLMSIYPAYKNLKALLGSDTTLSKIREDFGTYYNSHFLNLVFNYVVAPIINASLVISAVAIFEKIEKKQKIQILVMESILILMNVIMDAGRGILLYFLVMVYFAYKIKTKDAKLSAIALRKKRKYKLAIVIVFVLSAAGYVIVTKSRGAAGKALVKQLYVYACGCVPHLDYRISQIDSANICLYGTSGAHGLFQFIFTMLENFGIMSYPHLMQLSDIWYNNALSFIKIGPSIRYNAYATLYYNSYLDGGIIAVVLEMFIYGAFAGNLYKKVKYNKCNKRSLLIFIYVLYGICFSFIRFQFSLHSHWLAIVLLILLTRRKEGSCVESCSNQYRL